MDKNVPLNVLFITDRFAKGGLETHLNTFFKYLKERYSVNIVFLAKPEDSKLFNELLQFVDKFIELKSSNLIETVDELKEIALTNSIDVIHAHPFSTLISGFIAGVETNIPFCFTLHGKASWSYLSDWERLFFFKTVLPNSLGFSVNKSVMRDINYLPNPIDFDFWKGKNRNKGKYILIVSRLDKDKSLSVSKLLSRLRGLNVPVVVAGDGNEKELLENNYKWAKFVGFSYGEDLKHLMENSLLVCGMGRVVLEALALGKPVALLNYNGKVSFVDNETFLKAKEFNFNGTNIEDDLDFERKVDLLSKEKFEVQVDRELLEEFSAETIVDNYYEKVRDFVLNFKSYRKETKLDVFLFRKFLIQQTKNETLHKEVLSLKNKIEVQKKQISHIYNELEKTKSYNKELQQKINHLKKENNHLKKENNYLSLSLSNITNSRAWKAVQKYYKIKTKLIKVRSIAKKNNQISDSKTKNYLNSLKNKITFVFPPTINWNIPLYQRPHHFADRLSKKNYGFVFCTTSAEADGIFESEFIAPNLLLTENWSEVKSSLGKNGILILPSTNNSVSIEDLYLLKEKGWKIIYDYIDEITDVIASGSKFQLDRHNRLNSELVDLVLSVSLKLHEEMQERFPREKTLYLPNACDYSHFHIKKSEVSIPESIQEIVNSGRPIIGYYGALAKWIDYELILYLAEKRPGYQFLLIGPDYDGSLKSMKPLPNLFVHPPVNYKVLPKYAIWFDVAIIPFIEGEIAEATSPIKLFEYMALGKPTVCTSSLKECSLYKTPLIAYDKKDFLDKIDKALELSTDESFLELLDKEAKENTWDARVDKLLENLNICKGKNEG